MLWRPENINYLSPSVAEQGPLWPWYSSTYINSTTLPMGQALGLRWTTKGTLKDAGGNTFQIVKVTENVTQGQVLTGATPVTGTVTAAGSTVAVIKTNLTIASVNLYLDRFVYFVDVPTIKLIKGNTSGANAYLTIANVDPTIAAKPFDPDVLAAVPTNGTNLSVIDPYAVSVCGAATVPVGVALGAVTANRYTIMQIGGLAMVNTVGSGVATVVGTPATPTSSGSVIGFAGTATALVGTAAPQFSQGGAIIPLYAYNSTVLLTPCMINMTGV